MSIYIMLVAQVSMLLTGCTINGRLDQMTFIDCDEELDFISSDDDDHDDDDEVSNATKDTVRIVIMPNSLGIDRT